MLAARMLTDYLKENHIRLDFTANGKKEALEELCRLAAELHDLPCPDVLAAVLAREEAGSTGLGGGVALPHSKTSAVNAPVLILAVSPAGVDFDSLDGRPVHVFVLILTPAEGDGREHLQLLAKLGGLFKSGEAVEELLKAYTPAEVHDFLARRE